MIFRALLLALVSSLLLSACSGSKRHGSAREDSIGMNDSQSPFIAFNIWVRCGSQNDPAGKEGLALLTAAVLAEGSTKNNSYEKILEKLYPMAAEYSASVDKEMTNFSGVVHKDHLDPYYRLLRDAVLAPAFKAEDFQRIKSQTLNYLKQTRRYSNDEELSKELLFHEIYRGTPYAHPEEGYVASVNSITLEDVIKFYSKYYLRNNVTVAVGGGFPSGFKKQARADFNVLPEGRLETVPKPKPASIDGIHILLVDKNTSTSPVSFGFPISLLRSDKDFYAMMLFNSWMGEHRNSVGRLYQVIREARGINYGDYTYIEAFPRGFATQVPPVNVARRSQIFEGWLRPIAETAPGTLHGRTLFTLKAALRELATVIENGISATDFESTRLFLTNYTVNYGATLRRRLAYRVDDQFYGIPDPGFLASIKPGLEALTLDQVNAAIRKHLQARNMRIVIITRDAEGLKKKLVAGAPAAITYAGPQTKEILEEDRLISAFPIPIPEKNVSIININDVFESSGR
jgi:zinc protease